MATNPRHIRVLLVNPTGWQKESVNLGLAYLAGSLHKAGHRALILDLIGHAMSDELLSDKIREFAPHLIGVSVKTATAREAARLADLLSKACPDVPIVAGGPHVTLCADDYLRDFPVFDFGLLGEAEESVVQLADALAGNGNTTDVRGLAYRDNGTVVSNPWGPVEDPGQLPLPDFDAIYGFNWVGFRYPIVTSRSCPFQCIYCCVNKLTGSRKWRPRSVQNVVNELELMVREKGIEAFETWDDNFTLSVGRAKNICRELISRNLNLSWYCHNGIRADRMDEELARLMKQAGCTSVAFGMESGHPEVFSLINKGESLSDIVDAVQTVKSAGIQAVGYFIIGLPGDSLEKFIETVRFERSLDLDYVIYGTLVPYPKTEAWDIIHKRGKMLVDITQTRQFGPDVVPISFELPEFPSGDMVRAFYISKYFELYEEIRHSVGRGERPTVIYSLPEESTQLIPGMIAACDPGAGHIVTGPTDRTAFRQALVQAGVERRDMTFADEPCPDVRSRGPLIFVCTPDRLTKRILLMNSAIIMVCPWRPHRLLALVRRPVTSVSWMPSPVLVPAAVVRALRTGVREFGFKTACRIGGSLAKRALLSLPKTFKRGCTSLIGFAWRTACFTRAKNDVRNLRRQEKRTFPFDDHSSHM